MPAKVMLVPGMKPRGLLINWLRSSMVQLPPLAFIAAEKLNPASDALGRPTTPHRLGPTMFRPPLLKVWQAWHFFAEFSPRPVTALASSCSIGCCFFGSGGFAGGGGSRAAVA